MLIDCLNDSQVKISRPISTPDFLICGSSDFDPRAASTPVPVLWKKTPFEWAVTKSAMAIASSTRPKRTASTPSIALLEKQKNANARHISPYEMSPWMSHCHWRFARHGGAGSRPADSRWDDAEQLIWVMDDHLLVGDRHRGLQVVEDHVQRELRLKADSFAFARAAGRAGHRLALSRVVEREMLRHPETVSS
uniref:hypothetical protein n=1 Tax=Gordonia sp. B7-2 TaxID=3420932 RepID=UPI003D8A1A9B